MKTFYTSAYSPELNIVEYIFAKIKKTYKTDVDFIK